MGGAGLEVGVVSKDGGCRQEKGGREGKEWRRAGTMGRVKEEEHSRALRLGLRVGGRERRWEGGCEGRS